MFQLDVLPAVDIRPAFQKYDAVKDADAKFRKFA